MLINDWMTREPITVEDETSMIKAIHIMKQHRFRRLPVTHQGRLVPGRKGRFLWDTDRLFGI
ncbi:MAG: CBS domain-containing protein [Deltaproteobacteria bacterium]|nr:CBS domain-containing protein [Deltaproteobacteria bacterium]